MPGNIQHNPRPHRNSRKLHQCLPQLLGLILARLQQLRNDRHRAHIQERTRRERQQHVSPGQAGSQNTLLHAHRRSIGIAGAAEFLHGDTDEGAEHSADGGDELGAHGLTLGEAGLDEQGKVADLVGDLVEEDGHGGGCADGWGGVKGGGHGEAVSDVVGEVGAVRYFVSFLMIFDVCCNGYSGGGAYIKFK